ncbi:hypothetical protein F7731_14520 [Cytobacillus depressus]|uniref:Lipoprotein n=1 Tax=Cytobacillus depressus TaxID=1602942 RepID=A0A6L3V5H2_9BACI|nr:hypothetical protein [Cytobacillus depressus]KAB2334427.1 hypothetical protein F7731_14520 [Cytobacillus depressus]
MKANAILGVFLIIILSACSSSSQTVVTNETIFQGEGKYWTVKYIYNPERYEEKKVNWIEIHLKGSKLSEDDLKNIDIELETRDGLITGNVGDMVTKINGNSILFLVGTVNNVTYKEDEYKITIKFGYKTDVIKLQV